MLAPLGNKGGHPHRQAWWRWRSRRRGRRQHSIAAALCLVADGRAGWTAAHATWRRHAAGGGGRRPALLPTGKLPPVAGRVVVHGWRGWAMTSCSSGRRAEARLPASLCHAQLSGSSPPAPAGSAALLAAPPAQRAGTSAATRATTSAAAPKRSLHQARQRAGHACSRTPGSCTVGPPHGCCCCCVCVCPCVAFRVVGVGCTASSYTHTSRPPSPSFACTCSGRLRQARPQRPPPDVDACCPAAALEVERWPPAWLAGGAGAALSPSRGAATHGPCSVRQPAGCRARVWTAAAGSSQQQRSVGSACARSQRRMQRSSMRGSAGGQAVLRDILPCWKRGSLCRGPPSLAGAVTARAVWSPAGSRGLLCSMVRHGAPPMRLFQRRRGALSFLCNGP